MPSPWSNVRAIADVDPGVDRVRREVEDERRVLALRQVRVRAGTAAGEQNGDDGVQTRSGSVRRIGRGRICRGRGQSARSVESGDECAAASRSAETSRCRCRGRAVAIASTARSRRTSRICTSPTRSSGSSTRRSRATGSRSCWCSPARSPEVNAGVARAAAGARLRRLHGLRRVGVRAGARARAAAAHEPRGAGPRGPGAGCARSPRRRG